jgi:hypothetical protein
MCNDMNCPRDDCLERVHLYAFQGLPNLIFTLALYGSHLELPLGMVT